MNPLILLAGIVIILGVVAVVFATAKGSRKKEGMSAESEQKYDAKIMRDATRKLRTNPHHIPSMVALSDCFYRQQDYEKAFTLYNSLLDVVKLHPEVNEYEVSIRQGICAVKLDKIQEAYKGLLLAYQLKPNEFDTCYYLGYACYKNNDFTRAIPCLKKALAINPEATIVFEPMGKALYKSGKFKESLKFLRRSISEHPDDKETLFAMADAMYETGYGDKAVKIFMRLRPDAVYGPKSCLIVGKLHFNANQYDKAVQDFEIGLKIPEVPQDVIVELNYNLAQAYFALNKMGQAVDALKRIQIINPTYRDVNSLLTRYQELNQNSNLKVYMMSPTSDFAALCRKVVDTFYPHSHVKIIDISVMQDSAEILCEVETPKWTEIEIFRFYRTSGVVADLYIRDFHAKIKETKADKGICFAAGSFSESAHKFIEGRPIDLVEKEGLIKYLKKIDTLH